MLLAWTYMPRLWYCECFCHQSKLHHRLAHRPSLVILQLQKCLYKLEEHALANYSNIDPNNNTRNLHWVDCLVMKVYACLEAYCKAHLCNSCLVLILNWQAVVILALVFAPCCSLCKCDMSVASVVGFEAMASLQKSCKTCKTCIWFVAWEQSRCQLLHFRGLQHCQHQSCLCILKADQKNTCGAFAKPCARHWWPKLPEAKLNAQLYSQKECDGNETSCTNLSASIARLELCMFA